MLNDQIRNAFTILGRHLPRDGVLLLARRGFGDRGLFAVCGDPSSIADVEARALTEHPERWFELVHEEDLPRLVAGLKEFPARTTGKIEYRLVVGTEERWISENVRVVPTKDGELPVLLSVVRDVTDEHRLRAEIAGLEERVWRSERLESVGALAGGIAHDFNNLLTTIISAAQLLEESGPDESSMEDIQLILDAARRGAGLVRQIVDYATRQDFRPETVDVSDIVEGLRGILARTLGGRIQFSADLADDLWPLHGDPAQLEQVLLNLAVNARDAMVDGGRLAVETANMVVDEPLQGVGNVAPLQPGRYVRLTVRDTGIGIDPDDRSRIFEAFFTTKGHDRTGRGIGLFTVMRIVRGFGGAIVVDSEPGNGSTFHVYLPVREEADSPFMARTPAVTPEPVSGARILVAEDDPAVRSVFERALQRAGHSVVCVRNANEAIQAYDRIRPRFDLLVADVILPDRSGPALHRALRRRNPDLPVLFVSGYGEDALKREGVPSSVLGFLEKPFTPEELTDEVTKVLHAARILEPQRALEQEGGAGE